MAGNIFESNEKSINLNWSLSEIATDIANERCNSLLKDVKYCVAEENSNIPGWPTPYPALLYCFATIDLFASFYTGRFNKNSKNMEKYLTDLMEYDQNVTDMVMGIFRHKLVHTAQPKLFFKNINGQMYSWGYAHNDGRRHLTVEKSEDSKIASTFWLSIIHFAEDINRSVRELDRGYISRLNNESILQENFQKVLIKLDTCD